MSNSIICPYYRDDRRKSISCEDTCRSYDTHEQKCAWIFMYCDSWEWQKCPYAADMTEAYARFEKGDKRALEKQKIKAMKQEAVSLRTKVGMLEKKAKDLEKKSEKLYLMYRDAKDQLQAYEEKIAAQISGIAEAYEQRICYLIDTFAKDGVLEDDIKAWAAEREFALVADYEEGSPVKWMVKFREDEEDDKDSDIQSEGDE